MINVKTCRNVSLFIECKKSKGKRGKFMSETQLTKNKSRKTSKTESKGRMKNLLMFLPNMFTLLGRLIKDSRVPVAEKALFAAAIVYVIMPLDFIPDIIPFVGQIDDAYLVALTFLRLVNRTDESVIREHWSGGGDIVSLANSVASLAPMFLPKRISRVLSAKVELAATGKTLQENMKKGQAIFVESSQLEGK